MNDWVITILLVVLIVVVLYQIRIDTYTRKRLFDVQIEMGQAQAATTRELPWSELKKIVNEIITFTIDNYILINGVAKLSDEELAINWTMMLNDICTSVETSISDEIKRQILKSISMEYLTMYIKNSVQLVIVYKLQNTKKNPVNDKIESIHNEVASISNKK
jgi:hypothetical protein